MKKLKSAGEAAAMIKDGATVVICGSGGGVMEPAMTFEAIEARFLETGSPNQITLMHCSGIGDKDNGGISRFAHKGMVRRVIGGHWGWSPRMQQMANRCEIEAYNFSQGVMIHLLREIAAKRPGLITKTGIETFVDPNISGGKLNAVTSEDIVERISLRGEDWLFYHSFPVDVAVIRGTVADEDGNISLEKEPANLDMLIAAQAAHNSGGIVIAQVKHITKSGSLDPRLVRVPAVFVDAVVVDPSQWQTSEGEYNPAFCGDTRVPLSNLRAFPLSERKVVARRAFMELKEDMVINLGFGMPDGVATVAAEEGVSDRFTVTIEQGIYGGIPAGGAIFGVSSNPVAMIDEGAQFDFYSGNGLDLTCLGLAQADRFGNVNVSKFGETIAGSGGFIDISQPAKKVIFCGTFTAGGLKTEIVDGKLRILQEGKHRKFIKDVEHITFSSRYAQSTGQPVLYVTERAVFSLTEQGLALIEYAPGVDIEKDILALMDFRPAISSDLREMDERLFRPGLMGCFKMN